MKKSIALLALAFGVTGAFAQDLTSKKGEPILPEAGDWSIGADASPFLNYMGNFFGKTTANAAPTWNFLSGQTITVKKFDEAQKAMRASFRLGYVTNGEKDMVADRSVPSPTLTGTTGYPNQAPQKENKWSNRNTNVMISVGMEKRKGKTRLQGYYGADLGIMISNTHDKFTYGNALVANSTSTASPNVPVTAADAFANYNSGGNVVSASTAGVQGAYGSARMTDRKGGLTFGIGVRAFIGAEYFFLPKMSFGAEFGWGIGFSMTGASSTKYETVGNAST
ncbi:MAG: hypothetical protein ACXVPD_10275, partial [Bacteroidia bacterium]